jgi:hypothetical protein
VKISLFALVSLKTYLFSLQILISKVVLIFELENNTWARGDMNLSLLDISHYKHFTQIQKKIAEIGPEIAD